MSDNVREFVEVSERKRAVGLELDELLDKRKGLAVMSRKMTERVTDAEREGILREYNRLVCECDSAAGRLRWQLEVLDHELDELAGVHGPSKGKWYD